MRFHRLRAEETMPGAGADLATDSSITLANEQTIPCSVASAAAIRSILLILSKGIPSSGAVRRLDWEDPLPAGEATAREVSTA